MAVDVTVVRTETSGYALGFAVDADGYFVAYYRDSESAEWTKSTGVAPFVTEDQARSWINWQTIIPFCRPS